MELLRSVRVAGEITTSIRTRISSSRDYIFRTSVLVWGTIE